MDFLKKLKRKFGLGVDDVTDPSKGNKIANPKKELPEPGQTISDIPSAPAKREDILRFIIDKLSPYKDEKNITIKGIQFFILCKTNEEEEEAKVALYHDNPDSFKQAVLQRKLKDNYIHFPDNWVFEYNIVKEVLPACRFAEGNFGLNIINNLPEDRKHPTAQLIPLEGQTSKKVYILNPVQKQKYCIGRGKNPKLESGRIHTNDIFFLDKDDPKFDEVKGKSNLFVSRNHAYIEYNANNGKYFLYADKGGLPNSGNKIKILKSGDRVVRVDILDVAHELESGDQIELGGEAMLLFSM